MLLVLFPVSIGVNRILHNRLTIENVNSSEKVSSSACKFYSSQADHCLPLRAIISLLFYVSYKISFKQVFLIELSDAVNSLQNTTFISCFSVAVIITHSLHLSFTLYTFFIFFLTSLCIDILVCFVIV